MKIREYLDHLASWGSDDREKHIRPLLRVLSPVSLSTLHEHQSRHFEREEPDYEAFKNSQNRLLTDCLQAELTEAGAAMREGLGLPPLTLDTDVELEMTRRCKRCGAALNGDGYCEDETCPFWTIRVPNPPITGG